jgi:hypothetical protein
MTVPAAMFKSSNPAEQNVWGLVDACYGTQSLLLWQS